MISERSLLERFRSSLPTIALNLAVSAVFIGVVILLRYWKGIPVGRLTRDPSALSGAPVYTGFLSFIGIIFWSATAAICLFSAKLLSRQPDSIRIKRFLFVSGLLTLVLVLDDAFLLHDDSPASMITATGNAPASLKGQFEGSVSVFSSATWFFSRTHSAARTFASS